VTDPSAAIEDLFRREWASLIAMLARRFGPSHLDLAEDVVQEALERAMSAWRLGLPTHPKAWIVQTAKRCAIDRLRHLQRADRLTEAALDVALANLSPEEDASNQLAMMFSLCDEGRELLRGIEQADSVALDPHKTLFLPYGTGAALVRDGKHLTDAFSASGEYIRPLGESEVGPSPADLSPELTRHFRALRLWLPLQIAGVSAFRAAQSEKLALARYFHGRLSELDGFDPGPPPDLSVVAFRYVPKDGDANEFTDRLLKHLQQGGRVMMSGTRIDGINLIRCAILSFRTHLEHVDQAIEAILDGVKALNG